LKYLANIYLKRNNNHQHFQRYLCNKNSCNTINEFPRFNDIEKLLVTRSGRCGEFANCFTFLCRCLGYDSRYAYSTSDHVWTEVYNHTKKRWIHIDPSENVFDSPLMYEHGWKRKLEYVIAFAKDDIQDVTWRYSNKHQELLGRRKLCTEKELIAGLIQIRQKRQASVSQARKKFLTLRTFAELAELLIIREPTENELKGRSSGSLSWRLERGEANKSNFFVFSLMEEEIKSKQFNVRYSCARNIFERFVDSAVIDSKKDWKDWLYQSENIFRKVEHDHKMAYLSRTEDSSNGTMQLKFDFANFTIKNFDFKFDSKTFESGKIQLEFLDASDNVISRDQLLGKSKFSIKVRLSGGNGDCAWQHAQVFRQSLNSNDFPLQISIKFN
jgi:peptide-N4-(N-acetyl-beta-glucosaminyl)asparagine amidase